MTHECFARDAFALLVRELSRVRQPNATHASNLLDGVSVTWDTRGKLDVITVDGNTYNKMRLVSSPVALVDFFTRVVDAIIALSTQLFPSIVRPPTSPAPMWDEIDRMIPGIKAFVLSGGRGGLRAPTTREGGLRRKNAELTAANERLKRQLADMTARQSSLGQSAGLGLLRRTHSNGNLDFDQVDGAFASPSPANFGGQTMPRRSFPNIPPLAIPETVDSGSDDEADSFASDEGGSDGGLEMMTPRTKLITEHDADGFYVKMQQIIDEWKQLRQAPLEGCEEYKQQVANLEDTLEKQQAEITELLSSRSSLEACEARRKELERQVASSQASVDQSAKQVKEIQAQLEQARQTIVASQSVSEEQARELLALQEQLRRAEDRHAACESAARALHEQEGRANDDLQRLRTQVEQAQARVQEVSRELDECRRQTDLAGQLREQLTEAKESLARETRRNNALEQELAAFRTKDAAASEVFSRWQQRFDQEQQALEASRKKLQDVKSAKLELLLHRQKVLAVGETLRMLLELAAGVDDEMVRELQARLNGNLEELTKLTKEVEEASADEARTQQELRRCQESNRECLEDRERHASETAQLNEDLRKQVDELQEILAVKDKEAQALQAQLQDAQRAMARKDEEKVARMSGLRQALVQARQQVKQTEEQGALGRSALAKKEAELERIKVRLAWLPSDSEVLSNQMVNQEMEELLRQQTSLEQEVSALTRKVQAALGEEGAALEVMKQAQAELQAAFEEGLGGWSVVPENLAQEVREVYSALLGKQGDVDVFVLCNEERDRLRKDLQEMRIRLVGLEQGCRDKLEQRLAQLSEELKAKTLELQRVQGIEEECARMVEKQRVLGEQVASAERDLATKNDEATRLGQTVGELQRANAKAKEELAQVTKRFEALPGETERLLREKTSLEETVARLRDEDAALREQMTRMSEEREALEQEVARLGQLGESAQRCNEELARLNEQASDGEALLAEEKVLQGRVANLEAQVRGELQTLARINEKVRELDQAKESLEQEVSAMEERRGELFGKNQDLQEVEDTLQGKEAQLVELGKQVEGRLQELKQAEAALAESKSQKQLLEDQVKEREKALQDLGDRMGQARMRASEEDGKVANANTRLRELTRTITDKSSEQQRLQEEITRLQSTRDELQRKEDDVEERLQAVLDMEKRLNAGDCITRLNEAQEAHRKEKGELERTLAGQKATIVMAQSRLRECERALGAARSNTPRASNQPVQDLDGQPPREADFLSADSELDELYSAFRSIDADGDGVITTQEMQAALQGSLPEKAKVSFEQAAAALRERDLDKDGRVSFAEFLQTQGGKYQGSDPELVSFAYNYFKENDAAQGDNGGIYYPGKDGKDHCCMKFSTLLSGLREQNNQ